MEALLSHDGCSFQPIRLPWGQTERPQKKIAANEITVLDKEGSPRISLLVNECGPVVTFRPKDGPPRIYMGLGSPGQNSEPFLNFRSEAGLPLFLMGLSADVEDGIESPYFRLDDKLGLPKVLLGLGSGGKPFLHFNDASHDARLLFGVGGDEKAFLIYRDEKGNDLPFSQLDKYQAGSKSAKP